MRAVVCLLTVVLAGLSRAQNVFGDGKQAFALMPSEAISSGVVSVVSTSNSGRYILFRRKTISEVALEPIFTQAWYLYDRKSKVTKLLPIPVNFSAEVMSDDQNIVYSGFTPNAVAGFFNIKTESIHPVDLRSGYMMYGGAKPYAPFLMTNDGSDNIELVSPDRKAKAVSFGKNLTVTGPVGGDDENVFFHAYIKSPENAKESVRLTMNKSTGQVTQKPYRRSYEFFDIYPELRGPHQFSVNAEGEYSTIYYLTDPPNSPSELPKLIRIGPGNGFVQLSSQNDFVLYQDAGSLLLREIKKVDIALANKLWKAELLAKLVARAKTIGTAVVMWAADHDDKYPGQAGWEDELRPYVRERDIFRDFTYTFKGGNSKDIEDVSKTELGFFVASGGRVVVYADSHVKFVPNP